MQRLKDILFVSGAVAIPAGVWQFSAGWALIVLGVILIASSVLWHIGDLRK